MENTTECNGEVNSTKSNLVLLCFKKKKKTPFNTTLFLESVPTNAIFYRAIVQNDEPHIYTSGHLKRESRKM